MNETRRNSECSEACGDVVRRLLRERDTEAHVTTVPPLVPSQFKPLAMRCPHGQIWHAEPTSEQVARWAADGVE